MQGQRQGTGQATAGSGAKQGQWPGNSRGRGQGKGNGQEIAGAGAGQGQRPGYSRPLGKDSGQGIAGAGTGQGQWPGYSRCRDWVRAMAGLQLAHGQGKPGHWLGQHAAVNRGDLGQGSSLAGMNIMAGLACLKGSEK